MSSGNFCNLVTEAIVRVQAVLDPPDPDFIADLWIRVVDPSQLSIFKNEWWHNRQKLEVVANKILERIARFPDDTVENGVNIGNEAIEGIRRLINNTNDGNIKSNIFTIFNTNLIDDDAARIELLRLIKQADDAFGGDPDANLGVILNAMNGRIALQGNWYQLEFARKKGFDRIRGFEMRSGDRERGIDVVLEASQVDAADPIFYELKAGRRHTIDTEGAEQMFYHMEHPPISTTTDGWRRYRMAINTGDQEVLFNNGGKLLDALTTTTRYQEDPWTQLLSELDDALTDKPPNFDFETWVTNKNFANPDQNLDDPNLHLVHQARAFMAERFFEGNPIPEVKLAPLP